VLGAEVLADGGDLAELELAEAQTTPAIGRADRRREHRLEDRLPAEAVGDDLQPPALLDEQALQKVGRPGRPAMRDGQPQVGDAGLEVIRKAGDRAGDRGGVVGPPARMPEAGSRAIAREGA
jgi:hypothetical protein